MSYTDTDIWKRTLGNNAQDPYAAHRERLRSAYSRFRENAGVLAGEINRTLPDFTVHDQSHSDALWELADLIVGSDYPLNPVEAFVLGGAFLVHDLGMGLAAYTEGEAEVRETKIYTDALALYRSSHTAQESERMAFQHAVRTLHAEKAEDLPTRAWHAPNGTQQCFLIEDKLLRDSYGPAIGRIAHSHGWSSDEVFRRLNLAIGVAGDLPKEWNVDQLKLALLLRVADASQIDQRRAPALLAAIRKPCAASWMHWEFQSRMLKPQLDRDCLVYTAAAPFGTDQIESWWAAWDALNMVDRELRSASIWLQESEKKPFAARRVKGTESIQQMQRYVPTNGWTPVDAHLMISDVPRLIASLGGEQLYGPQTDVPLRELIQNGMDAVRAMRIMTSRSPDWGEVRIRSGSDERGKWVEVSDSGVGMSRQLLTGALLDFGKSYWRTDNALHELPGLLTAGFEPTGKYGIGFFSVFMWGTRVQVTTHHYSDGPQATAVLEFQEGLASRPLLRPASGCEILYDPGTRVRVWLRPGVQPNTSRDYCAWLCPSADVNIYCEEEVAVRANDWQVLDAESLLRRIWAFIDWQGREDLIPRNLELLSPNVRPIVDDGVLLGRACISGAASFTITAWSATGVVTVGGLRACRLSNIAGILIGESASLARDVARPLVGQAALGRWASEQAGLLKRVAPSAVNFPSARNTLLACGGDPGDLPIAEGAAGPVNTSRVRAMAAEHDELLVVWRSWWEERWKSEQPVLRRNVLLLEQHGAALIQAPGSTLQWPTRGRRRGELELLREICAEVWSVTVDDVYCFQSPLPFKEVADSSQGRPVFAPVQILKRP